MGYSVHYADVGDRGTDRAERCLVLLLVLMTDTSYD